MCIASGLFIKSKQHTPRGGWLDAPPTADGASLAPLATRSVRASARAASQRKACARWGGDRATRSVDGSGDGTGVGSGVESGGGSGVGSVVGSAVESGDGSGVGSADGSGDGTGVGSGVGSVVGSGVGSAVGSAVGSGDGSGVGSVDGSGIGRLVGSAAESDGGSGVVSRVSSARRSTDNQSRLPAFMLSDHRGFVIRPPGVCFQPAENKPALVCYRPIAGFVMGRWGFVKNLFPAAWHKARNKAPHKARHKRIKLE